MIWIVSDSAQELKEDRANGIAVMNLPVIINGEEAKGVIEPAAFFEMLDDPAVEMHTSQASPAAFEELFEELTKEGDEVVAILVGSALSGTFNSARLAADSFQGVYLVDSRQACMSQSAMTARAIALRDKGCDAAEIARKLEEEKAGLRLFAALPTLRYLKKSGRISPARAGIGDLASIRPILTINEEGEVVPCAKARGTRRAIRVCAQKILDEQPDFDRPFFLGYTGLDEEPAMILKAEIEDLCGFKIQAEMVPLSQMLCIHIGPGGCGAGFFKKAKS